MKSQICSVMALSRAVLMTGMAHGRNVERLAPIAETIVATRAAVNVVSYYWWKERSNASEFECHVGNVIVTV